jgi:hypothetical protein
MTNIEKIKFDSKFSVKYINGLYCISGFNHVDSLYVSEDEMDAVLRHLPSMDEQEWKDYISDLKGL